MDLTNYKKAIHPVSWNPVSWNPEDAGGSIYSKDINAIKL